MKNSFEDNNILIICNQLSEVIEQSFIDTGAKIARLSTKPKDPNLMKLEFTLNIADLNTGQIVEGLREKGFIPDAVYCSAEEYILLKSQLCAEFNIKFISEDVVSSAVEKHLMRQKFNSYNSKLSIQFKTVDSEKDIEDFIDEFGLPVIIKPSGLDTSVLISKAENLSEAKTAYRNALAKIDELYEKRNYDIAPQILVEQYITGPKYSVEAIVGHDGDVIFPDTVTDLIFGYDVGLNDPSNISRIVPSAESEEEVTKMLSTTEDGIRALGLSSCPIHAELIKDTNTGEYKVIEIAARIGGFREEMYKKAFGYSLITADLCMQVFGRAELVKDQDKNTSAIRLYALEEGEFDEVEKLELIEELSTAYYTKLRFKQGDKVGPAKLGFREVFQVKLCSVDRQALQSDHDKIINNLRIKTVQK